MKPLPINLLASFLNNTVFLILPNKENVSNNLCEIVAYIN